MAGKAHRKPIKNFFIKKSLQLGLTLKIMSAVMVATLICIITLVGVYYIKYHSVLLYQMNEVSLDLKKENIIYLLLPSLVISSIVNLVIAILVGLYASRKYAVPIYKLEQWAKLLNSGKLTAKIQFRERTEMTELTNCCNNVAEALRIKFLQIKRLIAPLKNEVRFSEQVKAIEEILNQLELESATIEIETTVLKIEPGETDKQG